MSPVSAMGPRDSDQPMETHWMAEDDECGIFAAGPKSLVVTMIADHFIAQHPGINPIVDGVHYRMYVAPMRCDICGVNTEPPFWDHHTPEPIDLAFSVDTEGVWRLCGACHEIVQKRDPIKLAIRMIKMGQELSPGLLRGPSGQNTRVLYTQMARTYCEKLDDGRVSA